MDRIGETVHFVEILVGEIQGEPEGWVASIAVDIFLHPVRQLLPDFTRMYQRVGRLGQVCCCCCCCRCCFVFFIVILNFLFMFFFFLLLDSPFVLFVCLSFIQPDFPRTGK